MERLGFAAVKKIMEIDAAEIYHRTGQLCWNSDSRKRSRLNSNWLAHAFTPAQINFLEKHSYTIRPHPKHTPTVEVYINEQGISDREWTLIRLLF
jgi:hypothetical protein